MARVRATRIAPSGGCDPRKGAANGVVGHGPKLDDTEGPSVVDDLPDVIPVSEREAKVVELYLGRLIDDLLRGLDHR